LTEQYQKRRNMTGGVNFYSPLTERKPTPIRHLVAQPTHVTPF
jgi:hypothetical protein